MKPAFLLACLFAVGLAGAEPVKIFNGTSLEGWKAAGAESYWTVADGVLKGESDDKKLNSILWTEKSYKDFSLELEYRGGEKIDSGVFLRHEKDQIQFGISGSLKRDMTCSPYISGKGYPKEATGVKELLKVGDWNKVRIVAKGNTYTISLNGKQVVEYVSDTAIESGPLGLQVHPGVKMKVEFRNVTLESLD
ncbi:MAG TPA: DUF1080 domain-containing protein [Haloferula sp.]